MLIGACLIEIELPRAESIKAKRSAANSIKTRLTQRFNLSVAEVGDQNERNSVCIGCVQVGVDPAHIRQQLERAIRFVESLGVGEVVGDDVTIARLDELVEVEEESMDLPEEWGRE